MVYILYYLKYYANTTKNGGNNQDMEKQVIKTYKKGSVIFGEGSYQPCMYDILSGTVGIYKDYGMESQVKLAELKDTFFGEMGLIEDAQRSATAVALEDVQVAEISEKIMEEYFSENILKIDNLLRTLSNRIRNLDRKYMEACGYINEYMTAENDGKPISADLIGKLKKVVENV